MLKNEVQSMARERRTFSKDFKMNVINQYDMGKSVAQIAKEYDIHPNLVIKWREQLKKYGDKAFKGNGNTYTDEARIAELERLVGELTMENRLLKKAINYVKKN